MDPRGDSGQKLDTVVEERLRASRPTPDAAFVRGLEGRLLERRVGRRARAVIWRPVFAGAAAAAAMAGVAVALGLAGTGPLATDGDRAVEATDDCRFVTLKRRERVPVIVTGRDGSPRLSFQRRLVERRVKRCD